MAIIAAVYPANNSLNRQSCPGKNIIFTAGLYSRLPHLLTYSYARNLSRFLCRSVKIMEKRGHGKF